MFDKLNGLVEKSRRLAEKLADPKLPSDPEAFQKTAREYNELEPIVKTYHRWEKVTRSLKEHQDLTAKEKDEEFLSLVKEEIRALQKEAASLEMTLKELLLPKDPNDERAVILEIRAGTGGEEASLFAAELLRMYSLYAASRNWRLELVEEHPTPLGGIKEVVISVEGDRVYSRLKYEAGVHRVQRVPVTESGGRIHTSAVTVAVLPKAEEVEVDINPEELRIDYFRASGPGGQHVNKTASAVRITHIPTNLVVSCQDEKSQHKNRAKAMMVLRARLLDRARRKQEEEVSENRRRMVGTGDRSERIRTYNFPQNRVTDHRVNHTSHRLQEVLAGNLDEFIERLVALDHSQAMQSL